MRQSNSLRNAKTLAPLYPATPKARPRLLIADDDELVRRGAARRAASLGYDLDAVATGRAAVQAAVMRRYALILLDCQMPELDGYGTARMLRSLAAEIGNVPIIGLTASRTDATAARCVEAGMNGCLPKPLRIHDLRSILDHEAGAAATNSDERRPNPAANHPVIDPAAIAGLSSGVYGTPAETAAFIDELIALFLEIAPPIIDDILAAIRTGNAPRLERFAHKLKGTCRNVGASQVVATCEELETRGSQGRLEGAAELAGKLAPQLAAASAELIAKYRTSG
jgi:CheY-like chemotaxis protein